MRKQIRKKSIGPLLAMAVFCTAIPVQASSNTNIGLPDTETVTLYPSGDENSPNISYKKNDNKYLAYVSGKVTLLKSSSSSKAKLAKSELKNGGKTETILYVKTKKVGTSTLSLKVKSKTYKIKVNVKKYQNPLASVKVGNKTLNMSKLKKTSNYKLSYAQFAGKKQKISVKMAPGWKLEEMYYMRKTCQKTETVKNGSSVLIKGGAGFEFHIVVTNKKTGQLETVDLFFV